METLMNIIAGIIFVVLAYLVGSISFGLLIGKLIKGIDIRNFGSGSTGATNVARVCGPIWGIIALILDMGKAAIPVALTVYILETPDWSHSLTGLSAIAGHIWPLFTNFKGGKGIASGWAALIVLSPWAGVAATLAAAPVIGITRYVSLGSIVGSVVGGLSITVLAILNNLETEGVPNIPFVYSAYGLIGGAITVLLHKDNVKRLIKGNESKLGQKN
ncbi:MAG: glycerol-3-phosphate 1-O-acyltransferase PlsY [SAR202 cluster bacterium]|jgi:glycerol-3-phosphate acyltransferase PlsY|nr:glycerol-3-phosphate 1-O-acyltransferase PlsY [SAR202 cluster bacterium AD-802-K11_MRT_200m]MQG75284.1 glycerol-3-phosphate 1-O-acyltransferase PlsY [SAR202 cluster bacterium]